MRCWKSASLHESLASSLRRARAYGYCGYRELRVIERGSVRRVTDDGIVSIFMESKPTPVNEREEAGGLGLPRRVTRRSSPPWISTDLGVVDHAFECGESATLETRNT
jgi:hypothetical protein